MAHYIPVTTIEPAALRAAALPCGSLVDPGPGSMGDKHHTPAAIEERIAWQRERFKVGTLVQRDDGCLVQIDYLREPTNGGYVYASGRCIDRCSGEVRGYSWEAGSLTRCSIVKLAD